MKKIPIIYWPKKGNVELNAQRIQDQFGKATSLLVPLKDTDSGIFSQHDLLIFGCSTVGADSWQDAYIGNPWTIFFKEMDAKKIDLTGKKIALFGLGDQILYPDHFVDQLYVLKREFTGRGAEIVGKWATEEYEHTESRSDEDGFFVGLALDEHNQDDMSEERVQEWVKGLLENHFVS